jgi:hypothetical protein
MAGTDSLSLTIQSSRPDIHSIPIIVSNLCYLWIARYAWMNRLRHEAVFFGCAWLIASLYHVCDENVYCTFGFLIDDWHFLDIFTTFMGVSYLSVYVMDIRDSEGGVQLEQSIRTVLTLFTAALVYYDRFSIAVNGLLWSVPIGVLIVRYQFYPPPLAPSSSSPLPHLRQRLMKAFGYLGIGLFCFLAANFVSEHPQPRPHSIPDTRYVNILLSLVFRVLLVPMNCRLRH